MMPKQQGYLHLGFISLAVILTVLLAFQLWHKHRRAAPPAIDEKPQVYVQQGHSAPVLSLAWSPDGRSALSGDWQVVKLWDAATGKELRTFQAHEVGGVSAVDFLPDGRQFLTAGTDSTVRIWDARTFSELRRLHANSPITSVRISSKGDRLLCAATDSVVHLWNLASGRELRRLLIGRNGSLCSALSPDGRLAATQARCDSMVAIWEVDSGRLIRELPLSGGTLSSITFAGSGSTVICGTGNGWSILRVRGWGNLGSEEYRSGRGNIEIWSVEDGEEIRTWQAHDIAVSSVKVLPDGTRVITGGLDGAVRLWDISTGRLIRDFDNPGSMITALAVSPDGHNVLTAGNDGVIRLWDIEHGTLIRSFEQETSPVFRAAFSEDGSQIRIAHGECLMLWDAASGRRSEVVIPSVRDAMRSYERELRAPRTQENGSWSFSWDCAHGLTTISSDEPGRQYLRFWSLDTGLQGITTLAVQEPASWDFSADGRVALTNTSDSVYTLWDVATGRRLNQMHGRCDQRCKMNNTGCRDVSLSADGRYALVHRGMLEFNVLDFELSQIRTLGGDPSDTALYSPAITFDIRISPDGTRGLVARRDGRMELWDTKNDRLVRSVTLDDPIGFPVISPDGRFVAAEILRLFAIGRTRRGPGIWRGDSFGLWDAESGKQIHEFTGHTGLVWALSFSPDERYLISASADGTARLWNRETGKEILQFVSFQNDEWIAATPEGYYTSSLNGDAFLNVRTGTMITGIEPYRSTFYQPAVVEAALRLGDSEAAMGEVLGCKDTCTTIENLAELIPPVLTVAHPRDADTVRTRATTLAFHIEDRRFPIVNVRVFVNGRPTARHGAIRADHRFPSASLDIPHDKHVLDLEVPVQLDEGDNQIVITALGKSEALSSLQIFVQPGADGSESFAIDTVWILAVGVDHYDDQDIRSLSYCQNDAREVIHAFEAQEGLTCRKVMSMCITDDGPATPTYNAITGNMDYLHQAGERDLAVLFMAGHGESDSSGNFYFLPSDAQVSGPHDFDKSTAISGDSLLEAVNVLARRAVFLDACHSGSAGVDLVRFARELKDNRALILTSSEGNAVSIESDSLKHGVFSYALIQGLEGRETPAGHAGTVTALQLVNYVKDRVSTLTGRKQIPAFWAPEGLASLVLAANPSRSRQP